MADKQEQAVGRHHLSRDLVRVFCANCTHCKLVRTPAGNGSQYYLRVRCDAGKWKKKLGEEKVYKYFTVARRIAGHLPGVRAHGGRARVPQGTQEESADQGRDLHLLMKKAFLVAALALIPLLGWLGGCKTTSVNVSTT